MVRHPVRARPAPRPRDGAPRFWLNDVSHLAAGAPSARVRRPILAPFRGAVVWKTVDETVSCDAWPIGHKVLEPVSGSPERPVGGEGDRRPSHGAVPDPTSKPSTLLPGRTPFVSGTSSRCSDGELLRSDIRRVTNRAGVAGRPPPRRPRWPTVVDGPVRETLAAAVRCRQPEPARSSHRVRRPR